MNYRSGSSYKTHMSSHGGYHGTSTGNSHKGSHHSTPHSNGGLYNSSNSTNTMQHQSSTGNSGGENPTRRLMVHLTDPNAASSILKSKQMLPGSGGVLGAGIYFCKTMDGCDSRALHYGTYILAEVYLGKTEANLNLDSRPQNVGSTVSGARLPMYAVNETRRVKNMRYLDGTIPPNTNINDIEMRSRMPLIFAATPRDAAYFIKKQELPVENRPEIAGKGFYLWKNIPDARKYSKQGATTFLAADVYFNNCFEKSRLPNHHELAQYSSFRGNYNGTHYFMVKNPVDIAKIHYIGGDRP